MGEIEKWFGWDFLIPPSTARDPSRAAGVPRDLPYYLAPTVLRTGYQVGASVPLTEELGIDFRNSTRRYLHILSS